MLEVWLVAALELFINAICLELVKAERQRLIQLPQLKGAHYFSLDLTFLYKVLHGNNRLLFKFLRIVIINLADNFSFGLI